MADALAHRVRDYSKVSRQIVRERHCSDRSSIVIYLIRLGPKRVYTFSMQNEFTAVIEQDGDWFVGFCPEIPEANGQGKSVEECRENLSQAIALVLKDRREDALRGVPPEAIRDVVRVA